MKTDEKKRDLCVKEWGVLARKVREGRYKLPIDAIVANGKNTSITITGVSNENKDSKEIKFFYLENDVKRTKRMLRVPRDIDIDLFRVKYGRDTNGKFLMLLSDD